MKRIVISTVMLSAAISRPVLADTLFTPENVTTGISFGTLSGETKERVYAPDEAGRKVSQLNWKYKNAAIIKGHIDWDLMPYLTLGASGWSTLAGKGAHMDDYDWQNPEQKGWTDHSKHPNTRLNYANQFDLNAKGWIFNQPDWRLGLMAGYQQSRYSFHAKGGSYNYNNGTVMGDFDNNTTVIGYKQRFKMPYIGLTGQYLYNKIEFAGTFKYSNWVRASDTDQHYLTTTTFHDKVHNQNYYALEGSVGYWITDNTKIYIDTVWSRITNKKGSLEAYDRSDDSYGKLNKGSGIESYSLSTSVGLNYRF